mgnify:CR=1 FL=1
MNKSQKKGSEYIIDKLKEYGVQAQLSNNNQLLKCYLGKNLEVIHLNESGGGLFLHFKNKGVSKEHTTYKYDNVVDLTDNFIKVFLPFEHRERQLNELLG